MEINISDKLKTILNYSTEEALRMGKKQVGLENVVLGILRQADNKAVAALRHFGIDPANLKKDIERSVEPAERDFKESTDKDNPIPVGKQVDQMVKVMFLESLRLKQSQVEPEHALLAILKDESTQVSALLNQAGITYERTNDFLKGSVSTVSKASQPVNSEEDIDMHEYGENESDRKHKDGKDSAAGAETPKASSGKSDTPVLDNFGRDLTKAAR
ncbi:MAG: hypothetical protein K2M74_04650, partial [Bacteroidales bacterium]|nr:hypothetical protein [Bacteroidales bacterium]